MIILMIWSKNLPPLKKRRGRFRTRLVSIVSMLREHWHLWKGLEKKTVFTESLRRRNWVNVFEVVRLSAKMSFPVCCLVSVKLTSFLSWIFHVIPVSCIRAKCVCIPTTLQRLNLSTQHFNDSLPHLLLDAHATSRHVVPHYVSMETAVTVAHSAASVSDPNNDTTHARLDVDAFNRAVITLPIGPLSLKQALLALDYGKLQQPSLSLLTMNNGVHI